MKTRSKSHCMKGFAELVFCKVLLLVALLLVACTTYDDVDGNETENPIPSYSDKFVYTMHLESSLQDYDEHITRSSYTWPDKSRIYMVFFVSDSGNAGSHDYESVNGVATYNYATDTWEVVTEAALPSSQVLTGCAAYYFENKEIETKPYTLSLDETTPVYSGRGEYNYSQGNSLVVSVTLSPSLWRLRFRGTEGTKVKLQSNNISLTGTFEMLNGHVVGGSDDIPLYTLLKDDRNDQTYSLTVGNSGYTPYIYGSFRDGYIYNKDFENNELEVETDGCYTRTVNGRNLQPGESGVITLPTMDNYAQTGWALVSISDLWPEYAESALGKTYAEIVSLYGNPLVYEDDIMGYYMYNDYINVAMFCLKDGKVWLIQLSVLDDVNEMTIVDYLSRKYTSYRSGTDNAGDRYVSYINAATVDNATIGISYYPDLKIVIYQDLNDDTSAIPDENDNDIPVTP